jgi:hypothetical protein
LFVVHFVLLSKQNVFDCLRPSSRWRPNKTPFRLRLSHDRSVKNSFFWVWKL